MEKTNKRYLILLIFILITGITTVSNIHASTDIKAEEEELFLVAQKAFDDGFYDVAIRYIEQFLNKFPQTEKQIQARLLLGQCYFFKSQYLKAFETFQGLLQFSEFKDTTLFWLGETYFKGSDYREAEKHYWQLIELYPDSAYIPQAYYSLGWTYFEQNDFKKAKDTFLVLIKKFPTHQLSEDSSFKLGECEYNLGSYEIAIQYFKNYVLKYIQSTRHAEAYLYIAEAYYYLEDFLTAITYYARSAEIAYDYKLTFMSKVSMGWCYLKLGKHELAKKAFDDAQAISDEKNIMSDDIFLGQANLYSEMGENKKALEAYKNLIDKFKTSPRIVEAHLGKANIHYALKDYDNAISEYHWIIENYGSDVDRRAMVEKAYYGLAWTYLKSGKIDQSIRTFEVIMAKTGNKNVRISSLTQIGDAYQDIDELDKAIDIYDRILKDYPESIYTDYVQFRQAIALLKLNRIEAATLSFKSLETNFPESKYLKDVKYYLGVAYFKKSDWTNAINNCLAYLKLVPTSKYFTSEAKYIIGLSYFNLKDYKNSQKYFNELLSSNPDQESLVRVAELNIAKCTYFLGNEKVAIRELKIISEKYPKTDTAQDAIMWLADHYLEKNEIENAILYYTSFLESFPGSKQKNLVNYELGQAYYTIGEVDKAINYYKLIDNNTNMEIYAKAQLAIAEIFSKDMEPTNAIETYSKIIESTPEFKRDAFLKIAQIYKKGREYDKVVDSYVQALSSKQGLSKISDAELQFYIADTFEILNKTDNAIETYLKIPYLYTNEVSWIIKAYLRIARIFEDQEKWNEARITYEKILIYRGDELKHAKERIEWIDNNVIEKEK